jgi:hypothetical protein
VQPFGIGSLSAGDNGQVFESYDCKNTGSNGPNGTVTANTTPPATEGQFPNPAAPAFAPCTIAPDFPAVFGGKHSPLVFADP